MAYNALKTRDSLRAKATYRNVKMYGFLLGIVLMAITLIFPAPDFIDNSTKAWRVIGVMALMLAWWISEVVPIPITALVPIIVYPVFDIMPIKQTTAHYGHYIVFLFLGGFMIALAMERWKLHLRIALYILRLTGTHANGIILGFMVATAFLSMWMSNTATTVMMLPIASSVLALIFQSKEPGKRKRLTPSEKAFALSMMLSIAFAANIGGIGTLIGTPPNAIFAGFMSETYGYEVDFATWMMLGVPFAIVALLLCWLIITHIVYPSGLGRIEGADTVIDKEWNALGKMSRGEKLIGIVFFSTAMLWMFKRHLPFDISDSAIAILAAVSLFVIPVNLRKGTFLLSWEDTKHLPWGILLLFGGGLSLAGAMGESGLVDMIAEQLKAATTLSLLMLILIVVMIVQVMTQVMSNLALISVFLPVVVPLALAFNQNPLLFAIPATLAASCAFMLPMSTPPNAIVFASGHVTVAQMMRAGILVNVISVILILVFTYTVLGSIFDIQMGQMPDWSLTTTKAP